MSFRLPGHKRPDASHAGPSCLHHNTVSIGVVFRVAVRATGTTALMRTQTVGLPGVPAPHMCPPPPVRQAFLCALHEKAFVWICPCVPPSGRHLSLSVRSRVRLSLRYLMGVCAARSLMAAFGVERRFLPFPAQPVGRKLCTSPHKAAERQTPSHCTCNSIVRPGSSAKEAGAACDVQGRPRVLAAQRCGEEAHQAPHCQPRVCPSRSPEAPGADGRAALQSKPCQRP